jgi:hypothetical protein
MPRYALRAVTGGVAAFTGYNVWRAHLIPDVHQQHVDSSTPNYRVGKRDATLRDLYELDVQIPSNVALNADDVAHALLETPCFALEQLLTAPFFGHYTPLWLVGQASLKEGQRFTAWEVQERKKDHVLMRIHEIGGLTGSTFVGLRRSGDTVTVRFGSTLDSINIPTPLLGIHNLCSRVLLAQAALRLRDMADTRRKTPSIIE